MSFSGVTSRGGYTVRVPKGREGLTNREEAAIQHFVAAGKPSRAEGCTIVLFHGRSADPIAVQRCDHRELKAHNRHQCRAKSGTHKGRFIRCR